MQEGNGKKYMVFFKIKCNIIQEQKIRETGSSEPCDHASTVAMNMDIP